MKVKALTTFQINKTLFNEGNEYFGSKVNDNWYVIDAVGISVNQFNKHFTIIHN